MPTSVQEIYIPKKSNSSYFLRVDWKGRSLASGFQILLTNGQDAWRGEVSEAVVNHEAEEMEMQTEKYTQDLQKALVAGEDSYSFTLTPDPPDCRRSVTLVYEKMQKDISFRLGGVLLEVMAEPVEAIRELLVHSLHRGTSLEHQNNKLEEENERLRQEQQRISAELRRYAGGKEALEAELFSRFVPVLNKKKAKIRSLQETLTNLQEARSSDKSVPTAGLDGEDDYGGSTDEEQEDVQMAPASSLPSRESSTPSPLDDSLRDITDVAPCRKRRFRHLEAPTPTMKKPNPESSQRRRTNSPPASRKVQSKQSSEDAAEAAEDLFEDF
ncbi:DNA repair protein XRCC4 [Cololabis saira]|uniref:DNA repair protein XRCC4 n=1 Tax=Cololabis saira TaxID=129043 RepID=UPI002AD43946|nr:DNA repair protein XRCC4 [Cololabis saira]